MYIYIYIYIYMYTPPEGHEAVGLDVGRELLEVLAVSEGRHGEDDGVGLREQKIAHSLHSPR